RADLHPLLHCPAPGMAVLGMAEILDPVRVLPGRGQCLPVCVRQSVDPFRRCSPGAVRRGHAPGALLSARPAFDCFLLRGPEDSVAGEFALYGAVRRSRRAALVVRSHMSEAVW